jgi:ribonuclease T2
VKIPSDYLAPAEPLSVSPDDVAAAFVKANPGLPRTALAVACDASRLTEVRVCITKDLAKDFTFHDCADVVSHACKRDKIAMPAAHAEINGMK